MCICSRSTSIIKKCLYIISNWRPHNFVIWKCKYCVLAEWLFFTCKYSSTLLITDGVVLHAEWILPTSATYYLTPVTSHWWPLNISVSSTCDIFTVTFPESHTWANTKWLKSFPLYLNFRQTGAFICRVDLWHTQAPSYHLLSLHIRFFFSNLV